MICGDHRAGHAVHVSTLVLAVPLCEMTAQTKFILLGT